MHRSAAAPGSTAFQQVLVVDSMKMVISGMPSPESVPAWVQGWLSAGVAEWVPPQALLAQQAASTGGAAAPVVWLYQAPWASTGPAALRPNSWISLQRQALRHRAKQPEPWVLVNIEAVNPDLLAEELGIWVADTEDAALSTAGSANTSASNEQAGSGLAALWAKLFEWSAPQAWDVYEALEAAAWAAPGLPQPWVREQLPTPELRSLEALQKQMTDAAAMQSRVAELESALRNAQDGSRHQLECALQELERTKALAGANSQQAQEAEAALARAHEQLTQAQLEADALLQQLHQVQEELEQLFLHGKEREATEAKARDELQAAVEQARTEGRATTEQAKAEGRASLEQARAEGRAAAEMARAEGQAAAERAQQAAQQAQALADQRAAALTEAQQEGELLLLQLHQVQEELETHFLRGKDLEQQLQAVRLRYARLQRRHPNSIELDSIEVAAFENTERSNYCTWQIKGLQVASHLWKDLIIGVTVDESGTGVFLSSEGHNLIGNRESPLVIDLLRRSDQKQFHYFRKSSTTNWNTLNVSAKGIQQFLSADFALPKNFGNFDRRYWSKLSDELNKSLQELPSIFRFDTITINSLRDAGDYQFIWFKFENASFGPMKLEGFSFRLSVIFLNEGNKHVGHPRVEFPLLTNGEKPFLGWFEESGGEFGKKFELRTDATRSDFDLGLWLKLPVQTRGLLASIYAALPLMLDELRSNGKISEAVASKWQDTTKAMNDIIKQKLRALNTSLRKDVANVQKTALSTQVVPGDPSGQEKIISSKPTEEQLIDSKRVVVPHIPISPTLPPKPTHPPKSQLPRKNRSTKTNKGDRQ
jgi:hypothetical protein